MTQTAAITDMYPNCTVHHLLARSYYVYKRVKWW